MTDPITRHKEIIQGTHVDANTAAVLVVAELLHTLANPGVIKPIVGHQSTGKVAVTTNGQKEWVDCPITFNHIGEVGVW